MNNEHMSISGHKLNGPKCRCLALFIFFSCLFFISLSLLSTHGLGCGSSVCTSTFPSYTLVYLLLSSFLIYPWFRVWELCMYVDVLVSGLNPSSPAADRSEDSGYNSFFLTQLFLYLVELRHPKNQPKK